MEETTASEAPQKEELEAAPLPPEPDCSLPQQTLPELMLAGEKNNSNDTANLTSWESVAADATDGRAETAVNATEVASGEGADSSSSKECSPVGEPMSVEAASESVRASAETAPESEQGEQAHPPSDEGPLEKATDPSPTEKTEEEAEAGGSADESEGESENPEEASDGPDAAEQRAAIPRLQGRQTWRPKGQRRSFGRLCKGKAAAGGCAEEANASSVAATKKKWMQEQQRKMKQLEARAAEKQARAVKEKIRLQRRKQREARRQQKKENEMKSSKVQVIKDTTKIRKWSKQARRQLVKMSPEMIRQLYGVQI